MKKISEYNNQAIKFIESSEVKDGVVCDVYEFVNDDSKDLGIVSVQKGCKTPLQLIVSDEKTLEVFQQGQGVLTVTDQNGDKHEYNFPSEQTEVEVKIGEKMQWEALEDLVFAEIYYPPYKEGRFENLTENMTKNQAMQKIWDYMHMSHKLKKADVIFVLGSRDIRVAEYATKLYFDGLAPIILFSGSGDIHNHKPGREKFVGSTEAEVFASVALKLGVPEEAILIENKSQNTGDNYKFALELLEQKGINPKTIIAVQKPYMERRTYATGKVHLPSDIELIVASPPIPVTEYPNESNSQDEHWLHAMVGDLQRIKEYPAKGFQIEQEIPDDVWQAYEFLVDQGYNKRLIKD